ncbi:hypothetical protein SAMN05428975_2907 [Mucilaginibacter sp. OK268]|uniref:hypothetical protein n=1 Tax=Mucilaginibacter sp. OK268 TaxID=1881048 RepID=UPI00088F2853|nr:hypothetical protein [Mucilaginibacter sp. OK268]SDP81090.1 hypothetical protein SAMN05428975_2907 [Mucilaginibacter sp. OK268]
MLLLNFPTRLPKTILTVILLIFIQNCAFANITFDWNGILSSDWTVKTNWTITANNGENTSTVNYPGESGRTTDVVRLGVALGTYLNQPVLANNVTVSSITFGSNQYVPLYVLTGTTITGTILTINGATLTVSGDITQNYNSNSVVGSSIFNDIRGTGTLTCTNLQFGNTSGTVSSQSFLISEIANFNINTNININLNAKVQNGSGIRLEGGTMTLTGQITFTNRGVVSSNSGYFTVNALTSYKSTNTVTNPTLILKSTTAIGTMPTPYASCNFYGDHGGKATIIYQGTNPLIYTSAYPGFGSGGGNPIGTPATSPTYDNLVIQGTGTAVVGGAGGSNPAYLTIDSTLTTASNTTFNTVNTTTIIGVVNGATGAKWTNNTGVTVTGGAGTIDINGSLSNAGTMTMGTGNLTIAKDYTNAGVFTPNTTALITFDGTAAQTLIDNTTAGTKFNNVTFTNGTTGATSKRMKLNSHFFVNPTYTINVNGSGILTVENTPSTYTSALTLLSTSTGDASIGNLTAGAIAGKIDVQRFITGGARRYMLISSPVADTTNTAISATSNSYSLKPIILPGAAGTSTIVTGLNGSVNGFDSAPATNNSPSVFVYNENAPGSANQNQVAGNEYKGLTNTSVSIPMGNGILLYYRGSRALLNSTTGAPFVKPFPAADDGTLTFFGSVIKGTTATNSPMTPNIINLPTTNAADASTYPLTGTTYNLTTLSFSSTVPSKKGYNLVGNPYASVIDLAKVGAGNTTLKFYYLLIKNASTGPNSSSTRFVLCNTTTLNSPVIGTGGSQYVLSGQGFFVVAPAASTKITFDESMKVPYSSYSNTTPPIFNVKKGGPAVVKTLAVNGGKDNKQATASLSTEAATINTSTTPWVRLDMMQDSSTFSSTDIYFDKTAQAKFVPGEDAPYLASSGQGNFFFSQTADSIGCFANYTTGLEKLKRINLFIAYTNYGTYKLTAPIKQNIDERYTIFLKDKFTNDSLDVVHNAEYTFNVTTAPASYARDRFYLSIGIASGHEYKLRDFNGAKQARGIKLTWQTDNESNSTTFVVEKSTNGGNSFIAIDSLRSTGAGSYNYTDMTPGGGQVFYRLKQQLVTDRVDVSKSLAFNYLNTKPLTFIVYPSTASQSININFGKTYSNSIKVSIATASGGLVKTITVSNTNYLQQNIGNLLSGLYVIEAVDESTGKRIGSAKFYKQ